MNKESLLASVNAIDNMSRTYDDPKKRKGLNHLGEELAELTAEVELFEAGEGVRHSLVAEAGDVLFTLLRTLHQIDDTITLEFLLHYNSVKISGPRDQRHNDLSAQALDLM